jgi:tRNA threonylcarbamoyladenosine modification (KEOPS) complex  Pcc1 subunit
MNEIINEESFFKFMIVNGPKAKNSKNNYISWLRYISLRYNIINEQLSKDIIDRVAVNLQNTSGDRDVYKTQKDISNIKSALNKYLKFIQEFKAGGL